MVQFNEDSGYEDWSEKKRERKILKDFGDDEDECYVKEGDEYGRY